MLTTRKKLTTKIPKFGTPSLRKILNFSGIGLYEGKEYPIQDRSSKISIIFSKSRVRIYNGIRWKKKKLNNWSIGFKFGEFALTRKTALYKAKQRKKKK